MRFIEPIIEHEMVALFLKTEIQSVRYRDTILALLQRDGITFLELILVGTSPAALIVLEGHVRLTAYCLPLEWLPAEMTVLVGLSPSFALWE